MFERDLQRVPALIPLFARKRMLDVAQAGFGGGAWVGEQQAFDATGIVPADLFQPVFGVLAEVIEGAHADILSVEPVVRLASGRKKVKACLKDRLGGNPLPRTGGAPARTGDNVARNAGKCQRPIRGGRALRNARVLDA